MSESLNSPEEKSINEASTSEISSAELDEQSLQVDTQEETKEISKENLIVEGENLHGNSIEQDVGSSDNINISSENSEKQMSEIKIDEQHVTSSNESFPKFDLMTKTSTCAQTSHSEEASHTPTAEEIDQIVEEVKNIKIESKDEKGKVEENLWIKQESTSKQLEDQSTKEEKISRENDGSGESLSVQNKKVEDMPNDVISSSIDLSLIDAPGPCVPQDLIEGIIFSANYLGSTQLQSKRNANRQMRMMQANEAVNRIKSPDNESQPNVEIDLFVSTDYIKILNLQTQETMMEHTLRTISYIADIGNLLVVMARRKKIKNSLSNENLSEGKVICHVFSSENCPLMAQAIGQAFNVAYQHFLISNGIESQQLSRDDYNKLLDDVYHDDLEHYTKDKSMKEVWVSKKKGEPLGVVIVESGWGSIVPTVILANLQHGAPAEKSGKLSIGDQIISVNGTSLVGLPLSNCQQIIKNIRSQTIACFKIVSCPPAVTVIIKRPHIDYQLGFSIQEGIICSLMRGGIAERGGVRVGHRIIEINGTSVVATEHDKIVKTLVTSVGEIQMKTMPAAMFRLLTGQETPIYI